MSALLFTCLLAVGCIAENPQKGLERLMKGNDRYVHDQLEHPNRTSERREAVVSQQCPFAVIVGCSDSRVAPEIIFDQGVGDLFVVRVAGNVVGPLELDSVEYSVLYFNSSVVLVMGHENCGAVSAVVKGTTQDIEAVAQLIEPAVREVKKTNPSNLIEAAIKANAIRVKNELLKSSVIQRLVKEKKVEVYAAYYHLQDGKVELLKE